MPWDRYCKLSMTDREDLRDALDEWIDDLNADRAPKKEDE